jgi:hypothetical protein
MAPKLGESPQSEAQETFAGTPGKDRDAPIPVIRASLTERLEATLRWCIAAGAAQAWS